MSWPARRAVLWMFEHPHLDEAPQSSDDMAGFAKAVVKNPAFHCGKSKKTLDFPTAGRTLASGAAIGKLCGAAPRGAKVEFENVGDQGYTLSIIFRYIAIIYIYIYNL